MLATVLVLAFASVAAVTDLLWNKIYNWNTYSGILVAFVVAAMRLRMWSGASSLMDSFVGFLLCGLLMVVCVALFPDIGGGDVKLMAMLGAWLGWDKGIEAVLLTFVLAACFGLIGLIWKIGPLTAIGLVGRLMANRLRLYWLAPHWFAPLSDEQRKVLKPPIFIAPSALAAVALVIFGSGLGF